MTGVSPALPETKDRNGAQPLAAHPLAQEFTMVLRAGVSLPAERKALGAVEGCSRGLMAGVSPALPETKDRNGAQPLAALTNYKYHPTKVMKKNHISN